MAKKDNTIFWIIGIVVAVIVMAQFVDIGDGVFAIAGGGAGSSVSQIITSEVYDEGFPHHSHHYITSARPPIGETWLITYYYCGRGCSSTSYAYIKDSHTTRYISQISQSEPGLRLFIDNNFYLVCTNDYGGCAPLTISGVRV